MNSMKLAQQVQISTIHLLAFRNNLKFYSRILNIWDYPIQMSLTPSSDAIFYQQSS